MLKGTQIGVTTEGGIITLTGTVNSYAKKLQAENAARNVDGVTAVVEKIEVKSYSSLVSRNDNEIASEIGGAVKLNSDIPSDSVRVKVDDRWVTLEGHLLWNIQREAVQKAVTLLFGIKGIANNIIIKVETKGQIGEERLLNAFRRNASLDARKIGVEVLGATLILSGTVVSSCEKSEAGRLAWNKLGVEPVGNAIVVEYENSFVANQ